MGLRAPAPPRNCEVLLPFPERVVPLSRVRSTIVLASMSDIKTDGFYDDYVKRLAPGHKDALLDLVAGMWMPAELAAAHYSACDALHFTAADQTLRGRRAADRVGGSIFGTAIRAAREAGATPWTIFAQLPRFWSRAYDGGGLAVYRTGPKDARIDLLEIALCDIPYYRRALAGWMAGTLDLFCERLYFHDTPARAGPGTARFVAQWA
jgi:hypothetical protein